MAEAQVKPHDIRDKDLIKVTNRLFDAFCREHGVDAEMRPSVTVAPFLKWLGDGRPLGGHGITAEQLVAELRVTRDSAQYVLDIPRQPRGPSVLIAMWPLINLAGRTHVYDIRAVSLATVVLFEDGVVVPIMMLTHKDIAREKLDDSNIVHLLITRNNDMVNNVGVMGLDNLHDAYAARFTGTLCPDTLQYLRQLLDERAAALSAAAEPIPPEWRKAANLLDLVAQLHPWDVPDHVKRQMTEVPPPAGEDAHPVGGFNG